MATRRALGDFTLAEVSAPCAYCGEVTPMVETATGEHLHVGRCTRARFAELDAASSGCDYRRCEPDDCALFPLMLRPFRCRFRVASRR